MIPDTDITTMIISGIIRVSEKIVEDTCITNEIYVTYKTLVSDKIDGQTHEVKTEKLRFTKTL